MFGIRSIRSDRDRYAAAYAATDPRPSRFAENGSLYRAWALRADAWADRQWAAEAAR